jgi:conjugal transfer/entry exclusion protein
MTIEVALLISGVSLAFGIYQGVSNMRRNNKQDDKKDAAQLTTVIVKLENINDGVTEIKSDLKNIKDDIKEFREWKATVTQQIKALEKNVFKNASLHD